MSGSYLALGGIILDDLVYQDGNTSMGVLGGGGLYSALGARLWSEDVWMAARVGPDFNLNSIGEKGLSTDYIEVTSLPTPRAWQLLDHKDERTQVARVSDNDWDAQLVLAAEDLPNIPDVVGMHILGRGLWNEIDVLSGYSKSEVVVSYEPVVGRDTDSTERDIIIKNLSSVSIFSPDLDACKILTDQDSPLDAAKWFASYGPEAVVVRMGKRGAILLDARKNELWHIPSAAGQIVNTVGAGNAFCGGFLVGWCENQDLCHASACAAVSASITMENIGPPTISSGLSERALKLHQQILSRIRRK